MIELSDNKQSLLMGHVEAAIAAHYSPPESETAVHLEAQAQAKTIARIVLKRTPLEHIVMDYQEAADVDSAPFRLAVGGIEHLVSAFTCAAEGGSRISEQVPGLFINPDPIQVMIQAYDALEDLQTLQSEL